MVIGMGVLLDNFVREEAAHKKVGVFGTGTLSHVATSYLHRIGVEGYSFFDNNTLKQNTVFNGKKVLDPKDITSEWFILVSAAAFSDISYQLKEMGLKEVENYISVLESEYYESLLKCKDAPKVPDMNDKVYREIEKELRDYVELEAVDWFDEEKFDRFEAELGFQEVYGKPHNKRYRRKIMEYFFAEKLLCFDAWGQDDIYLDIGAAGSPFAKFLRQERNIKAFAVDLNQGSFGELNYYLQEDATQMHFTDGEVKGISMQSSFEMFVGDADIRFIREAARVLGRGGKLVISPLYMHRYFLSTTSPNYYQKGFADRGALECIRTDCRGGVPLGRFYSACALEKRVLSTARSCGLMPTVYVLPDDIVERDAFVYLKYILCMVKD